MIVVKIDDLARQDNLFLEGAEPDWRYNKRRLRLEEDDYTLLPNESDASLEFPHLIDPLPLIKKSYIEKEKDGLEYFQDQRAALVVQYQLGNYTESDLYDIEDEYDKVFKRLRRGDWKSAQNKLSNVTIGGAVTQAYHDSIVAYIDAYVLANY